MSRRRRVLLVSHEASRTGAPRVAADIGRALTGAGADVTLLMRWGGPLEGELRAAATRARFERLRHLRAALRRWPRAGRLADRADEVVAAVNLALVRRPDLVFANTAKSAAYVRPALRRRIPTVLHVHESGALLSDTLARYRFDEGDPLLTVSVCSAPVADEVAEALSVQRHEVQVLESHVDPEAVVAAARSVPASQDQRVVVGACAVADHRKGIDLWLAAVEEIRARRCDSVRVGRPHHAVRARRGAAARPPGRRRVPG